MTTPLLSPIPLSVVGRLQINIHLKDNNNCLLLNSLLGTGCKWDVGILSSCELLGLVALKNSDVHDGQELPLFQVTGSHSFKNY